MASYSPRWFTPGVAFILLVLATALTLSIWFHPKTLGGVETPKFTDPQKNAVAVTLEMNKLVISLASLVFGAVGTLVFAKEGGTRIRARADIMLIVLTVFAAGLSIYFSYVTYDKLVEMLSNQFLDLNGPLLSQPRAGQIYSLTLSVACLGMLVVRLITSEPANEENDDALDE
jgi:hypothetical protein